MKKTLLLSVILVIGIINLQGSEVSTQESKTAELNIEIPLRKQEIFTITKKTVGENYYRKYDGSYYGQIDTNNLINQLIEKGKLEEQEKKLYALLLFQQEQGKKIRHCGCFTQKYNPIFTYQSDCVIKIIKLPPTCNNNKPVTKRTKKTNNNQSKLINKQILYYLRGLLGTAIVAGGAYCYFYHGESISDWFSGLFGSDKE